MSHNYKALIFDLGGVLLDWNPSSDSAVSQSQLRQLMHSTTWHDLERGKLTLDEACELFGDMLGVSSVNVHTSLDQAQKSLAVNTRLARLAEELKKSNPELQLCVMSNISKEHFQIVQNLDLPWPIFTSLFASGNLGMRKPELCFFAHVLESLGVQPGQAVLVDDQPENICAARSIGIHGLLMADKTSLEPTMQTLRNLFQDQLPRAKLYMEKHAGEHHCVVEDQQVTFKDNFAQLLIWELTGNQDLVYLRWPSGKVHGPQQNGYGHASASIAKDVKNGLWNYFYDEPVLTTHEFPPDADTTATAYLSLPAGYLSEVADVNLVLDELANNTDPDGLMQTYFSNDRPRTCPEVCCNILRVFNRFGHSDDPRIKKAEDWVVQCLENRACLYGSRHYTTPETFLYFTTRLYVESGPGSCLKNRLEPTIKEALLERVNVSTNPVALALRISALQLLETDPLLYRQDLAKFMCLQETDGGWPAGHFCCLGRTGARIGNRGLTTALAMKILGRQE